MEEKNFSARRSYYFRLDTRQIVLLASGYLFICVLVFIIGVVVGRGGALPDNKALKPTEAQKVAQNEPTPMPSTLPVEEVPTGEVVLGPSKSGELSFYHTLADGEKPREVDILQEREQPLEREVPPSTGSSNPLASRTSRPSERVPVVSPPTPSSSPPAMPAKSETEIVRPPAGYQEETKSPVAREGRSEKREGRLTIQVSSFRELALANALKRKLEERGFDVYISSVTLPEKGVWHRVQIGSYQEKTEAKRMLERIKKEENIAGLITRQ